MPTLHKSPDNEWRRCEAASPETCRVTPPQGEMPVHVTSAAEARLYDEGRALETAGSVLPQRRTAKPKGVTLDAASRVEGALRPVATKILESTVEGGAAAVLRNSTLNLSHVNLHREGIVTESKISSSKIEGEVKIQDSHVHRSLVETHAGVISSTVTRSRIRGSATVENSAVEDDSEVSDRALVKDSKVLKASLVGGNAEVEDSLLVNTRVSDTAQVRNVTAEGAVVRGDAMVGHVNLPSGTVIGDHGEVFSQDHLEVGSTGWPGADLPYTIHRAKSQARSESEDKFTAVMQLQGLTYTPGDMQRMAYHDGVSYAHLARALEAKAKAWGVRV